MQVARVTIATVVCAALPFFGAAPVRADTTAFPAMPSDASAVSDADLSGIRGKYIPPTDIRAAVLAMGAPGSPLASAPAAAGPSGASPLSNLSGSGSVTYFGIAMVSTWTVKGAASPTQDSVGLNVGIDVPSRSVSIQSWSAGSGGGIPGAPSNDSVSGNAPLTNISSGVGQSIQIAGDGNAASNEATVTYTNGASGLTPVPVINTCGAQCSTTVGNNAFSVSIVTPRGTVSQMVGSGTIGQSVQAWGDANQITNQLGITIHSQPTAPLTGSGMSTILNTLIGIP